MRRVAGFALILALSVALGCEGVVSGEIEKTVTSDPQPTPARAREPEGEAEAPAKPRRLRVEVVESYPHDREAFTQGLLLEGPGTLLESTGHYGVSELRRVDLETGEVMRRQGLPAEVFGEGLARVPGGKGGGYRLMQITWREGVALLWDAASFERRGEFRYSGEGWGLCYQPEEDRLVMSDGSPRLTFRDPRTFAVTREVTVTLEGRPLGALNELECVDGRVWANVYGQQALVEIDPAEGRVTAVVNASGLLAAEESGGTDVLNGIAHDPSDGTFLLTGKLWPRLFRVRFVEESAPSP